MGLITELLINIVLIINIGIDEHASRKRQMEEITSSVEHLVCCKVEF